jgi:hypothetical protein
MFRSFPVTFVFAFRSPCSRSISSLKVALWRLEVDPELSRDGERLFVRERFLDLSRSDSYSYLLGPMLRAYTRH